MLLYFNLLFSVIHQYRTRVQSSSLGMKKIIRLHQRRFQITKMWCQHHHLENLRMLKVSIILRFLIYLNCCMLVGMLFYSLDRRLVVGWHYKFIGVGWCNILAIAQRSESKENCDETTFGLGHRIVIKFSRISTYSRSKDFHIISI